MATRRSTAETKAEETGPATDPKIDTDVTPAAGAGEPAEKTLSHGETPDEKLAKVEEPVAQTDEEIEDSKLQAGVTPTETILAGEAIVADTSGLAGSIIKSGQGVRDGKIVELTEDEINGK